MALFEDTEDAEDAEDFLKEGCSGESSASGRSSSSIFLGILPLVEAAKKMEDEIVMKRKTHPEIR